MVDLLDGTINYAHKLPLFVTALCLVKKQEPILSVIYSPNDDVVYTAIKGGGSQVNGKKITVNALADLKKH